LTDSLVSGGMRAEPLTRADGLGTATLSDALDRLGLAGQCCGVLPLRPDARLAGPAFTVRYRAAGLVERGTVGDYIDDVPPGSVVVLDNAGRLDCTVWGDVLTGVADRRAIAGTVINGVCRDGARAIEIGYPLFARGRHMRTGKDRVEVDTIGEPADLGGVPVRPGDLVVGDGDGVVVVPRERITEVIAAAREIDAAETAIEAAVASGLRLADARRRHGYHALQTRAAGQK
jgi:4-hydroxy-4-methyl-2-oxoglutarate aldolase